MPAYRTAPGSRFLLKILSMGLHVIRETLEAAVSATHHRALHSVGDKEKWLMERQVDPIILAEQLWRER